MKTIAVIVLLASLLLIPTASSEHPAGRGIVRIFAKSHSSAYVDMGMPGPTAGDLRLYRYTLEDNPGHAIGYAAYSCTRLGALFRDQKSMCDVVIVMPRGRILASGIRRNRDHYLFAVIGGTGVYEAAGGTMLGNYWSTGPRRERLLISLI